MSCSFKSQVSVHIYGKPNNYSLKGFNIDGVRVGGERIASVKSILGKHSSVSKFIAPHPGAKGTLADRGLFQPVPDFPRFLRGVKGDMVEIVKGEAYAVSAADCLVGYITIGEKVFAFHAGWQEIRGLLAVLVEQIEMYGDDKILVRAEFGFGMEQEYLSLDQNSDSPPEVQHVLDLARETSSLEIKNGKNFICLKSIMLYILRKHCTLEHKEIPSNTSNIEKWWSNRLDRKSLTGDNQSNLVIIHRHS